MRIRTLLPLLAAAVLVQPALAADNPRVFYLTNHTDADLTLSVSPSDSLTAFINVSACHPPAPRGKGGWTVNPKALTTLFKAGDHVDFPKGAVYQLAFESGAATRFVDIAAGGILQSTIRFKITSKAVDGWGTGVISNAKYWPKAQDSEPYDARKVGSLVVEAHEP